MRPTRITARKHAYLRTSVSSLFGLAPGGVYLAADIAASAVRSYRTLSPLPIKIGGLLSVALSLGSPPPGVTRHRVSVEPGLSSVQARKLKQRPSDRLAKGIYAELALRKRDQLFWRASFRQKKRQTPCFVPLL